jgi:hypothetical protein
MGKSFLLGVLFLVLLLGGSCSGERFATSPLFHNPDRSLAEDQTAQLANIKQEYQRAIQRGAALQGCLGNRLDPLTMKDIAARRFINRWDWENYLSNKTATAASPVDPAEVYKPAPLTWNNWWKVATQVNAAIQAKTPLSVAMIEKWNSDSLAGTDPSYEQTGEIRTWDNYATNLYKSDPLTPDEVAAIKAFQLPGISGPALRWDPAVCYEDLPKDFKLPGDRPECQQIDFDAHHGSSQENADDAKTMDQNIMINEWYQDACWPRISDDVANAMPKVCGFFHFISHDKVPQTLQAIVDEVNQQITTTSDPIRLAMMAQLHFVGTHPFVDGNGRTSRWIEDYVLFRSGLPPVFLPNMDHDLSTPTELYIRQAYSGAEESLQLMSNCLSQYEAACSGQGSGQISGKKNVDQLAKIQISACGILAPAL